MNAQTRTIIITVIATLAIIVVLQNLRSVGMRFILWETSMPLPVLITLVFAAGVITGFVWRRK